MIKCEPLTEGTEIMEFVRTILKEELQIKHIISLHYFEFAKDFIFEGEKHDFWELLYVDKGDAEVMADEAGYKLKQGDIIFHKPNEFHSVWANKTIAPNLVVVSFECKSEAMEYFQKKIFNLGDIERNLLATIVSEGFKAFLPPLDMPRINILKRKPDSPFGCEQIIKIHLELLLISLVKKGNPKENESRLSTIAKQRTEDDIIKRIHAFMLENISSNLTLDKICHFLNIGRTHLKTIFKAKTGMGTLEYFKMLKIEKAKLFIREEQYNLSEISEILGYSSIHSFSRHFKNATNISPSEYAKTIKARFDRLIDP